MIERSCPITGPIQFYFFCKIMEKTTSSRLSNYIEKIAVLYPYQFGFRPGYSTDIALINMQELITKAIDTKKNMQLESSWT